MIYRWFSHWTPFCSGCLRHLRWLRPTKGAIFRVSEIDTVRWLMPDLCASKNASIHSHFPTFIARNRRNGSDTPILRTSGLTMWKWPIFGIPNIYSSNSSMVSFLIPTESNNIQSICWWSLRSSSIGRCMDRLFLGFWANPMADAPVFFLSSGIPGAGMDKFHTTECALDWRAAKPGTQILIWKPWRIQLDPPILQDFLSFFLVLRCLNICWSSQKHVAFLVTLAWMSSSKSRINPSVVVSP